MWLRGKVFVLSREEVTGRWRKMHNEEPRDFYCVADNIRFVKPRRKRWVSHVACMEREDIRAVFWRGNLKERD
jgi:hypothetical protein